MTYDDLPELHYITSIENLPSIFEHGILSHRRAEDVEHVSVAMSEVQKRRAKVKVPGGRKLHEYVNLYFHARNPIKCAEVLVPDRVDTTLVRGVYVSCEESKAVAKAAQPSLHVKVSANLFFR